MQTTTTRIMCLGAILVAPSFGCITTNGVIGGDMQKGLVLVLPGAEGQSPSNESLAKSIHESEVESCVVLRDWTRGTQGMIAYNQRAEKRNRSRARQIASYLSRYSSLNPDSRIQLVGHSAGAAMAIYIAEAMPNEKQIDAIYLLAPSLSPRYDLSTALLKTEFNIHSYCSKRDMVLLAGTPIIGTVDGKHEIAAGWAGFEHPLRLDAKTEQYRKLLQHHASIESGLRNVDGSHYGWTQSSFITEHLSPLIRAIESDTADIKRGSRSLQLATKRLGSRSPARINPILITHAGTQ